MARKKSNSSSSSGRVVLAILITLFILYFGVTGGEIPEWLEPFLGEDNGSDSTVEETSSSGANYDLYFTEPINTTDTSRHQGAQVETALIAAIDGAKVSIDGALFELNMESITDALIRAHQRNVKVRLVFDDEHGRFDDTSTVPLLERAGIPVVDDGRPSTFMHNKYLIIDGSKVWMGSMNFTHNDIYNNNNNAILINSTRLAQNYTTDFEEMFIDGGFSRRDSGRPTPNQRITLDGIEMENYFSPEDGATIETRVAALLGNAQESIYMMAFSFTLDSFANQMVARHNDGVKVTAIIEDRAADQGAMPILVCGGVPTKTDGNPQTFHHKVFVIDGEYVVFGSFNFSANARDSNSENMLIIRDATFAQQFINEFERRYSDPDADTQNASDFGC